MLFSTGCRTKEKNPELLDPIYRDLQSLLTEYSKTVIDTEKEVLSLQNEIKDSEPNTKELHQARKKLREAQGKLVKAKQMTRYMEIRVERRRVEDLRSYSIAFEQEQEWPNPAEYSAYLANKKLGSSRLQWDARVPKLHARLEKYLESKAKTEVPATAAH